ncbi:hypothetical protein [Sporosarcina sp. Marseille-Q4943]|uniref:hypothetical protein n=1 Tax=Sporosarcina sp. Marseille-Q4943 TaxID=2942204 RepID=UPI00208DB275|nr:hypothetical protein [Sporosarcina sp. Marseille-Q4943]
MFWKRKTVERKERSDKKVHVGPTISVKLKAEIERLSFILDQPIQDLGVMLFMEGIHEREVMEHFAPHFQKGILRIENTLFYGSEESPSLGDTKIHGETDRISVRFVKRDYEDVQLFADLLGVSPTRAVAIMLDASIRHIGIIELLLQKHNNRYHFDEVVSAELKKLMRYINQKNPYKASWNQTLVQIAEGVKKRMRSLGKPVTSKGVDTETYRWNFD